MHGIVRCALVALSTMTMVYEGAAQLTSSELHHQSEVRGLDEMSTPYMPRNSTKSSKSDKSSKSAKSTKSPKSAKSAKSVKSSKSEDGGKGGKGGKGMKSKDSKKKMRMKMGGKGKGKGKGVVAPTAPPVTAAPFPGSTAAPSASPVGGGVPFPVLTLEPFTLFYTIQQFRLPLPSEFTAVAGLTEDHLDAFFDAGFASSDLVIFLSSTTALLSTDFNFGEPVGITYNTTLTFTQESFVPRIEEVEALLVQAFAGANLAIYLEALDGLPASNLFATTSAVTLETEVATARIASGSLADNLILGAAAGGGVAILAIAALVLSGRRNDKKKKQVRQKSLENDGHCTVGECTVGEQTYDSNSISERVEDNAELQEVTLD